jgi:hypothetical protein
MRVFMSSGDGSTNIMRHSIEWDDPRTRRLWLDHELCNLVEYSVGPLF